MEFVELDIIGLHQNEGETESFIIVLGDSKRERGVPIIIGANEAQSIAVALENIALPRPLTHDLVKSIADVLDFRIVSVCINKYKDGVFYSQLNVQKGNESFEIDSRTSDALALAKRFNCPIFMENDIFLQTSVVAEIDKNSNYVETETLPGCGNELPEDERRYEYLFDTMEQLQAKIEKAIASEDFETAAIIRDEINSRKDS